MQPPPSLTQQQAGQQLPPLRRALVLTAKIAVLIITIILSPGALFYGVSGLLHAYAHVSLPHWASWSWMAKDTLLYHLSLVGMTAAGVVGIGLAILFIYKQTRAKESKFSEKLKASFPRSFEAIGGVVGSPNFEENMDFTAIKRDQNHYQIWNHIEEGVVQFYCILLNLNNEIICSDRLSWDEMMALQRTLQKANFPVIKPPEMLPILPDELQASFPNNFEAITEIAGDPAFTAKKEKDLTELKNKINHYQKWCHTINGFLKHDFILINFNNTILCSRKLSPAESSDLQSKLRKANFLDIDDRR